MTGIAQMNLYQLYIKSEDTLLAAAGDQTIGSKILLSADGGKTWKKVADNLYCNASNVYAFAYSFFFDSPKHGYILGQGYYATTTDGGNTWIKTSRSTAENICSAITNSIGTIIFSDGGYIFSSTDGDLANANQVATLSPFAFNTSQFIRYGKTLFIVDDYGELLSSIDDGNTWITKTFSYVNSGYTKSFNAIAFLDSTTNIFCGSELTMYKTTDAGATWNEIVYGAGEGLNTIYCKNNLDCYIGGNYGRLFHTTDGGTNWTWNDFNTKGKIHQITFPTNDTGYVSSSGYVSVLTGLIFRTIDGGINWQSTVTQLDGTYLQFPSKDIGYIGYSSDSNPAIEKSIDAGQTWNEITDPNNGFGSGGACFSTTANGLVEGKRNKLLYTTDGGITWITKYLPNSNSLALEILSLKNNWVIFSIRDSLITPTSIRYVEMFVLDNNLNIKMTKQIIGDRGGLVKINDSAVCFQSGDSIYYSKNYGNTWTSQKTWGDFYSLCFPTSQIAYSVGLNIIYKAFFASNLVINNVSVTNKTVTMQLTTSDVSAINASIYLLNNKGDTVYTITKSIQNGISFSITLPETIADGTYTVLIVPTDTLLYNKTQSQAFTITTTNTAIVENTIPLLIKVIGNRIECNCINYEIYNTLGQRMQNNTELPTGIYIVKCNNIIQKVIIRP